MSFIVRGPSGARGSPALETQELFTEPCYIRAKHPAAYRSGEWASVCGVFLANLRPCYLVMFNDGKTDLWSVEDVDAGYEFAAKKWSDVK